MSNVPAKVINQLPAHLRAAASVESFNEITAGVQSGFPVLSIRGKVWRIRKSGEEQNYTDDEGDAVQSVELVLIKSNPQPSKVYYDKAYEEGNVEAPTCWSADGHKPDAGVQTPQAKACAACPNNAWGSKLTPSGAKTKACADARRLAVVFLHELEEKGADAQPILLRIPPASLNPLKDYAEKVLQPKGIPYFSVSTKIGFDATVAYPKLTFKAKQFLTEEQFELVTKFRESEDVRRILAESHEFEAGTTEGGDVAGTADPAEDTPAPASAPKPAAKKAAPKPVEAEDVEVAEVEISPAPAPAPKAAPKKTPTKVNGKKAAPAKVVEPEPEDDDEVETPAPRATGGDDFESMLDSILKG